MNTFWSALEEQESLGCTHCGNGIAMTLPSYLYDLLQLPFISIILQRGMMESKGSMLTDKRKHLKGSLSTRNNCIRPPPMPMKALVIQIPELFMAAGEKIDSGKPHGARVQHHQMVTPAIRLCPVEAAAHAVKTGHAFQRR